MIRILYSVVVKHLMMSYVRVKVSAALSGYPTRAIKNQFLCSLPNSTSNTALTCSHIRYVELAILPLPHWLTSHLTALHTPPS